MAEFISLGILCTKKDPKNEGEVLRDEAGRIQYYIKLDKDAKVKVNGKKVNGYINVKNPAQKIEERINSGKVDEEKIEQLEKTKARYEKGGDLNYIKQELFVVID